MRLSLSYPFAKRWFLPSFLALLLATLTAPTVVLAAPLPVAVSILPQKYFVEQIGGSHVQVQVMVRPGFEPATYEPTPRQIAELTRTRLYFAIGVPVEKTWLPRFKSSNPTMTVVDTTEGIERRMMNGGDMHDHGHDHGHEETGARPDPHIWLSPTLVRIQAQNIRDALVKADPAHAADYRRGYARLALTINRVDDVILQSLTQADLRHNRFMVFHPAFGYFAAAYGLKQTPVEVEGKEPSPRQLADLIALAKREQIHVVFVEPQFSQKSAQTIADAIDGRTVTIDPLDENWPAGMQAIAKAISGVLGQPTKP